MKKLAYLFPATLLAALALPACGDDTTAADTDGADTGSTTSDPAMTMTSPTMTSPTEPTTTGPTTGPTTTDPTIDPDSSSSDPGGCSIDDGDECEGKDDCGAGSDCVACFCVEDPNNICPDGWGPEGTYGDCGVEGNGVCGGGADLQTSCGVGPGEPPEYSVCIYLGCETECDCPQPPEGFEDQVACEDNFGDAGGLNECILSCDTGDCPDGMFCNTGICYWGEEPPPPGEIPEYGDCLNNTTDVCEDMGECLSDGATFGACGVFDCGDASECADAPDTGTAEPACTEFPDGSTSFCSLLCTDGETCPDGMFCLPLAIGGEAVGSHCTWGPIVEGFGDCINAGDEACDETEACVVDETAAPNTGVCATTGCMDPTTDCLDVPEGGDAVPVCQNIDGEDGDECALDCSGGEDCPTGMACSAGGYCAWDFIPPIGFDDCANNPDDVCLENETCIVDAVADPNTAVCAASACVDAATDCPSLPPGGDAAAACADIDGNKGEECVADCSGGETCPDGMVCTGAGYCAWDDAGLLLSEDFSSGVLASGWDTVDVDGQAVNAAVEYVTEAWTVNDVLNPGEFVLTSTSWYAAPGTSDDWIITPPVTMSATSVLSWDGLAPDEDFADGYEVYVVAADDANLATLIDGGDSAPLLMAETAVFEIADEAQVSTTRTLSAAMGEPLAPFIGTEVRIAWRNPSEDEFIVLLDNISVTE